MNDFLKEAVSLSLLGKCVAAVVGILFIHAMFRVLEQTLPRRFGRADARYRVRKFVVVCGYLAILLFLALLFEDRLGRLSSPWVSLARVWPWPCRTCWPALPALSRSAFQSYMPWATEFRSVIFEVT